jgi:hypothetical protein
VLRAERGELGELFVDEADYRGEVVALDVVGEVAADETCEGEDGMMSFVMMMNSLRCIVLGNMRDGKPRRHTKCANN